jgi:hypothetical protein
MSQGLPAPVETDAEVQSQWSRGKYDSVARLNVSSPVEAQARILDLLGRMNYSEAAAWVASTTLIPGFYNESLPAVQKPGIGTVAPHIVAMKPALLVNCDADQYIGSIQMFHFLLQNGLIVPGTLLFFDDWVRRPLEYTLKLTHMYIQQIRNYTRTHIHTHTTTHTHMHTNILRILTHTCTGWRQAPARGRVRRAPRTYRGLSTVWHAIPVPRIIQTVARGPHPLCCRVGGPPHSAVSGSRRPT